MSLEYETILARVRPSTVRLARLSELRNRWWFPDHLHVAPLWRDLAAASQYAQGRLLDLGCGNAPYGRWFRSRVESYIAVDHPPVGERAQVGASAERLPFTDAAFDTILCTQVLEHVPRPWLAAAEITRLTKPAGILILSCPQYWEMHEVPHDYFRFTPFGLRVLFPESHWEWLEHRQQGSTWAIIGCALWQSFGTFGRGKRLMSFVLNPVFLVLDRFWKNPLNTTNHLIVLRRKEKGPSRAA
ncbi:MAG: class I SAM-dependent methyltransferase [Limisphaerales bacterium]